MSDRIAFKNDTSFLWDGTSDVWLIFALIICIVVPVLYFVRHKLNSDVLSAAGKANKINVMERKPLSPKTSLYLIEVDGRQMLITESSLSVSAVSAQLVSSAHYPLQSSVTDEASRSSLGNMANPLR